MLFTLLLPICFLFRRVLADVEFAIPAPGAHYPYSAIQVQWEESGVAPPMSSFKSYELLLCAGGNGPDNYNQLAALVNSANPPVPQTTSFSIQTYIGDSIPNAYFLKMISRTSDGQTIINYSSRFSIDGMKGAFPSRVLKGLRSVSGTGGPPTEIQINGSPTSSSTSTASSTHRSKSSSSSPALSTNLIIAIAVVGGIAFLAVAAAAVIFVVRRHRRNRLISRQQQRRLGVGRRRSSHQMLSKGNDGPDTTTQMAGAPASGWYGGSPNNHLADDQTPRMQLSFAGLELGGGKLAQGIRPGTPDSVYQRTGGWAGMRGATPAYDLDDGGWDATI